MGAQLVPKAIPNMWKHPQTKQTKTQRKCKTKNRKSGRTRPERQPEGVGTTFSNKSRLTR